MPKRTLPPALKRWNEHVAKFRKAHPNLSFKQCLTQARLSYKK